MNSFWSKVDKSGKCWLWRAATQGVYGNYTIDRRKYQAHRLSYVWAWGDIPVGHIVDHLCVNKLCVRPSHLEAVTVGENNRRKKWTVHQRRVRYYELQAIRKGEGMLDAPEPEQLALDLFRPVLVFGQGPIIHIGLADPYPPSTTRRITRDDEGRITAIIEEVM